MLYLKHAIISNIAFFCFEGPILIVFFIKKMSLTIFSKNKYKKMSPSNTSHRKQLVQRCQYNVRSTLGHLQNAMCWP